MAKSKRRRFHRPSARKQPAFISLHLDVRSGVFDLTLDIDGLRMTAQGNYKDLQSAMCVSPVRFDQWLPMIVAMSSPRPAVVPPVAPEKPPTKAEKKRGAKWRKRAAKKTGKAL